MSTDPRIDVSIVRNPPISTHPFSNYFKGFEKIAVVREIFKEKTEEILKNLRVEFISRRGYMGVNDEDGHLLISAYYLRNGTILDIYLDIIHELVHVKQFIEGKKLFDERFEYVDRPTEIEAYSITVKEARRLGLHDKELLEYLKTEWISEYDLKRLAKHLRVSTKDMPI
jgi:hypothetical protein